MHVGRASERFDGEATGIAYPSHRAPQLDVGRQRGRGGARCLGVGPRRRGGGRAAAHLGSPLPRRGALAADGLVLIP